MFAAQSTLNTTGVLVMLALVATQSPAATVRVDPNDPNAFKSIQEAIDNAWDFDSIVVTPGSYHEHINFFGKAVSVVSSDPNDPNVVAATILDADGEGNVVTFNNAEIYLSVLDGFTITNGQVGIHCEGGHTQPVIRRCIIHSNATGIEGPYASPTIVESVGASGSAGGAA